MEIEKISKASISDQVYEKLKSLIIKGVLRQGEKLPSENDLAQSFGVSRITIRQALSKLTTLGLTETKTGEGSFIKELTPGIYMNEMIPSIYLGRQSLKEVFEFRLVIEVESTAIAAKKITDQEILELQMSVERLAQYKDNLEKYVDEDLNFHRIIARSTKNSLIIQMNDIMRDVLRETINDLTEDVGTGIGLKYHRLLIDAFKSRDENKAKELMREHLMEAFVNYSGA